MWKLSIEDDQGNKTVVNLVRDEYSVGRAETNTVRLTERNVSRQHARLLREEGGWVLEDLSSYNGVYVNGVRVGGSQPLAHSDLVQLGDYRLEVANDTAEIAQEPGAPASGSALARPESLHGHDRLVMLIGPDPASEFALQGDLVVIGRGEECDLVVNHPSVSRVHAEIHSLGDGRYEILDRDSANGVRINGVELQRSLLDARDSIELGDVLLKFIPAGQIYRPSPQETHELAGLPVAEEVLPVEAAPSGPPIKKLSSTSKITMGVAGAILLLGVGAFALTGGADEGTENTASIGGGEPAARVLAQARELLEKGDIEGAHQKVITELPEDSNARQSPEFREIEARWADALFSQAHEEQDAAIKQALLEQISRSPSVDSARRKRAAAELAELRTGSVDINELPSGVAAAPTEDARGPAAPVHPNDASPSPKATRTPSGAPLPTTAVAQAPATAQPVKAVEPAAAPKPTESAVSGGIVRSNPFDTAPAPAPAPAPAAAAPAVRDMATSGDRDQLTRAKASLQAKVQAGTATDSERRMLRALCRQLGDASCSN
jgi:pSer/pThr/pTyr-binding forkhead associated (FHA) protein